MMEFKDETGIRVLQRLQQETVIWLTTVSADGTPQPNPVWFYWDGGYCLVYSKPGSARLSNIARHPRVALNFEGATVDGGEVTVLTGNATVETDAPPIPDGYKQKYQAAVDAFGYTWEQLHAEYSMTIKIKPTKYRSS